MKFEKWQALGNDYLIIESENLPWELTAERIVRLCDPHMGIGSDGILLLSRTNGDEVAELRIFNPDGSEAALSGNGAREAAMYLRARGWTESERFTIATPSGTVEPRILDQRNCSMWLGTADLKSDDFPLGADNGKGRVRLGDAEFEFQFIDVGNPQVSIRMPDAQTLSDLDLGDVGPPIQTDPRFPNRTNVSFWTRTAGGIRARIYERGVGETLSSGTGASGAAVAALLEGVPGPIDVELDGGTLTVEIGPNLELVLTGWAVPVYSGETSPELLEELT
jgi:diaminopimelate epimerase